MADRLRVPPAVTEADRKARMQRVRIGLTGLAFVFLMVLLAAAILSSAVVAPEHDAAGMPNPDATPETGQVEEPREPLAELGVVPGNPPADDTTNAIQPLLPPVPAQR